MPLVRVEIFKGKNNAYKKALLDGIHEALVASFHIPDHDRMQRLYELDPDKFEIAPSKTDQCTLIEITAFPGRSLQAKKDLYRAIVTNLGKSPGIDGNDIMIVLHEPPLDNWGIRGGKLPSEANLEFDINI